MKKKNFKYIKVVDKNPNFSIGDIKEVLTAEETIQFHETIKEVQTLFAQNRKQLQGVDEIAQPLKAMSELYVSASEGRYNPLALITFPECTLDDIEPLIQKGEAMSMYELEKVLQYFEEHKAFQATAKSFIAEYEKKNN